MGGDTLKELKELKSTLSWERENLYYYTSLCDSLKRHIDRLEFEIEAIEKLKLGET